VMWKIKELIQRILRYIVLIYGILLFLLLFENCPINCFFFKHSFGGGYVTDTDLET
jgi:hypothetical protein